MSAASPQHWLLCDLGNSFLKLSLAQAAGAIPKRIGTWAHAEWEKPLAPRAPDHPPDSAFADLHSLLQEHAPGSLGMAISSVARPEVLQRLQDAASDWGCNPVRLHPDPGLELRVRQPHTVGMDRLYAARAAFDSVGGRAAVVVDAGTALTVDVVVPGNERGVGAFLGGAIAPGPDLLARALGQGAAQLQTIEPRPGQHALGLESSEALAAGVVVGFEGATLELVRRVALEANLQEPALVVTGGAAPFVTDILGGLGWGLCLQPELVTRGLWAAAQGPS